MATDQPVPIPFSHSFQPQCPESQAHLLQHPSLGSGPVAEQKGQSSGGLWEDVSFSKMEELCFLPWVILVWGSDTWNCGSSRGIHFATIRKMQENHRDSDSGPTSLGLPSQLRTACFLFNKKCVFLRFQPLPVGLSPTYVDVSWADTVTTEGHKTCVAHITSNWIGAGSICHLISTLYPGNKESLSTGSFCTITSWKNRGIFLELMSNCDDK